MKKNRLKTMFILLLLTAGSLSIQAQYGFGTNSPHPSAVVDMKSDNKGVLLPRVNLKSTTDVITVLDPADHLVVFNAAVVATTATVGGVTPGLYYWDKLAKAWVREESSSGAVGINTTTPDASAMLDISSTTQGLLPPRMTMAQIIAIENPDAGLMVYNTDMHCLMYYNNAAFKCTYANLSSNNGTVVPGNKAPTASIINTVAYPYDGVTANASASVTDFEKDELGVSTYQWYRYDDADGKVNRTRIEGATASSYKLTVGDGGKYVGVSVVPVASKGTSPGAEIYATPLGPVWTCGLPLTRTHKAKDGVSPLDYDVTVTYKTKMATIELGGDQCWILQNLGATSSPDSLETVATSETTGWFWQFARAQGYTVINGTAGPNWHTGGASYANITWPAAVDPCNRLLGDGWGMPGTSFGKSPRLNIHNAWHLINLGPGPYINSDGVPTQMSNVPGIALWTNYFAANTSQRPMDAEFGPTGSSNNDLNSSKSLQVRCRRSK